MSILIIVSFYTDILLGYTWYFVIWIFFPQKFHHKIFLIIQFYWFHILKFTSIAPTCHFGSNCGFLHQPAICDHFIDFSHLYYKTLHKFLYRLYCAHFLDPAYLFFVHISCLWNNFSFCMQNPMECLHASKLCENKICTVPCIIMIKVATLSSPKPTGATQIWRKYLCSSQFLLVGKPPPRSYSVQVRCFTMVVILKVLGCDLYYVAYKLDLSFLFRSQRGEGTGSKSNFSNKNEDR